MTYRFRLATLLKIRERERDEAGRAVQEAQVAIDRILDAQREIDTINEQMDSVRKQASYGNVLLTQLLDAQRYQLVLAAQSSQLQQNLQTLQDELGRRRDVLIQRQQAVKSLEKFREQRSKEAEKIELARNQSRLDEWSNIKFAHASQGMPFQE